jgi:glycosyltransferase involved in cell wall biosynthesis
LLLTLGQVRRYKNLPQLIACFRAVAGDDWRLVIAGEPREHGIREAVAQAAADDPRILLHLRFIPCEEVQIYFRASDLVVLPYADILNSGGAILALSFDRPVLVPGRGAMADLQDLVGVHWVMTYDDELTPETLRAAVYWALERRSPRAPLEAMDWPRIHAMTAQVYREVTYGASRP